MRAALLILAGLYAIGCEGPRGSAGAMGQVGPPGMPGPPGPSTRPDAHHSVPDLMVDASPPPPDALPDAAALDCSAWSDYVPSPGLGGPLDSVVDEATTARLLTWRAEREEERLREASDPVAVAAKYRPPADSRCRSIA